MKGRGPIFPFLFLLSFPLITFPKGKIREERGYPNFPSFYLTLSYHIISYLIFSFERKGKGRRGMERRETEKEKMRKKDQRRKKRKKNKCPPLF